MAETSFEINNSLHGESAARRQAVAELLFFSGVGDLSRCTKIVNTWKLDVGGFMLQGSGTLRFAFGVPCLPIYQVMPACDCLFLFYILAYVSLSTQPPERHSLSLPQQN